MSSLFVSQRFVEFQVRGEAKPAGSKRAFKHRTTGNVVVMDANRGAKAWKEVVAGEARRVMGAVSPLNGPLAATFVIFVRRPKSHLLSDGVSLSAKGREWPMPSRKPDLLKLARAIEDALTSIVYVDDSQIVTETLLKVWGDFDGASIQVREI